MSMQYYYKPQLVMLHVVKLICVYTCTKLNIIFLLKHIDYGYSLEPLIKTVLNSACDIYIYFFLIEKITKHF